MSKELERVRLEPFKPQPTICSCDQGKLCEEVRDLRTKLEVQRAETENYKWHYRTSLDILTNITCQMSELRKAKDEVETNLLLTTDVLNRYRRAFNVMRIINIIFTVGFAVMTAILIWR
jgi:hypothetical protein